jgi:PST family polysaccharide transporter
MKLRSLTRHRVFRNSLSLSFVQLSNYVTPLITLSFLTNKLGLESYSVLAFVIILVSLANVFTDYGFYLSATERVSRYRSYRHVLRTILGSVLAFKLALVACIVIIFILLTNISDKFAMHRCEILLGLPLILGNALLPYWFLQGLERMKPVTYITIGTKLLYLLLLLWLIESKEDVAKVLIISTVSTGTAVSFSWWVVFRMKFKPKFNLHYTILLVKVSSGYFFGRVASTVASSMNGLILGIAGNIEMVGIYSIAEQIYRAMQSAFLPVYLSLYPYMAKERNYQTYVFALGISLACVLLAMPFAYFVYPYVIAFLTTQEFIGSTSTFNTLLIALPINLISSFLGYPYLVALGKNSVANVSLIYGACVHLLTAYLIFAIGALNPQNIAIATVITESFVLFYRGQFMVRNELSGRRKHV